MGGVDSIPVKGCSLEPGSKVGGSDSEVEVWKLRCKLMAEKYFGIIKDLR